MMHGDEEGYMEDVMKCPICNEENKHQIWTERGIGTVEEYYFCENCGYFMEMAYSPIHEGIELLRGRKVFRQLLLLFRFRKKLRGLKFGKPHF